MSHIPNLILATLAGFLARLYMLRRDYRQYPSYPQGWAVHLFVGFIGAAIGAVVVPAVWTRVGRGFFLDSGLLRSSGRCAVLSGNPPA